MYESKKNKIERYLNGHSAEPERLEMESYFLADEPDSDFNDSLEKDFHKFINRPPDKELDLDELLDRFYKTDYSIQSRTHRFYQGYMKVAALLILPIMLGGLFLYLNKTMINVPAMTEASMTTIYAPMGSRIAFDLPDGTTGMLNSGSSISYSMPFQNNREIELSGEGWFDVKKVKDHPFIINTPTSVVTVLGTSFNLCAYPDEDFVELVLNSGKVEFLNKKSNEEIILQPADKLISEGEKMIITKADTAKYNSWTEGKLIFRGDPMGEVARRIMRWYSVDIVLADKELESYSFRGIFKDDKLEDILAFLAMTSPIEYEIIPRAILPDGTFGKEKIIISLIDSQH